MTFRELSSKIAQLEKGKSQANIGDIREILKILKMLFKKDAVSIIKILSQK